MSGPTTELQSDGRILVVDDKEDVLTAIRLLLKPHVALVHTTKNPGTIPTMIQETAYDVVLLDMNFTQDASSGREGIAWLGRILERDPELAVIMITAYGDVERAVRTMKAGAVDFIVKPWENERLLEAVLAGVRLRRSRLRSGGARTASGSGAAGSAAADSIVGESPAMRSVYETIQKVAATDANVLVLGENGTGKELVARAVHRASRRSGRPFVTADLGALSASLFESELFGYVRGAFTGADQDRAGFFEEASGGTLFLDEVANIPPQLQAKLLTVLQRREVNRVGAPRPRPIDIRLVSATNADVYALARSAAFRQDLLYRINTVEIALPPLRARTDDVPLLAQHFLAEFAQRYDRDVHEISQDAVDKMCRYAWPGNVRELRHTIERAVIMSEDEVLRPRDLLFSAPDHLDAGDGGEEGVSPDSLDLDELERAAVRRALSKHGGNISRAAEELGISRKALYRRIEKHGL